MSVGFNSDDIKFPCVWHGSLIMMASSPETVPAVRRIYGELSLADGAIQAGHTSANGSYVTWKLSSTVPDLATLRELFRRLEALPGERMLI